MTELATVDLTRDEATDLTARIREQVQVIWPLIVEAYQRRAWVALGYESWDGYCDAELRGIRPALDRDERPEKVAELRSAGMTTRAIGAALGVSEPTVRRDLAGASYDAPERVTGTDGKSYAPTQPARPEPEPVADPLTPELMAQIEERIAEKQAPATVTAAEADAIRGRVADALDRFVGPDTEAPARKFKSYALSSLATAHAPMRFGVDNYVELADEELVDELGRLARELTDFHSRVIRARAARFGDNVVALRGVR